MPVRSVIVFVVRRFIHARFFLVDELPHNKSDNFTAAIGGPFIKDRWHFYFGYENGTRDDKAVAVRLLTIRETDKAQLIAAGLPASVFPPAIPFLEKGPFYIFRSDAQLNEKNRLSVRFNHSDLQSKNFLQGGLNTVERSLDAFSMDYGLAAQLTSFTPQVPDFKARNQSTSQDSRQFQLGLKFIF